MTKLCDHIPNYKFKLGIEKSTPSPYYHVMQENLETEVDASEVDLSSFQLHQGLDGKIWTPKANLNPIVRNKLLEIGDDFWKTCEINWIKPKNMILTGSLCNYNWSKYSDIDLHLVVDFKKIHKRTDFVQEYFDGKKNDWNNEHSELTIASYPVELYVQDINTQTESGGIYDLYANAWLKKPKKSQLKPIGSEEDEIKEMSAELMTQIDDLAIQFESETDKHKLELLNKEIEKLLAKIIKLRKTSLQSQGEMSKGNIVYKELRRTEYLDKLWTLKSRIYDKINSIKDIATFNEAIRRLF